MIADRAHDQHHRRRRGAVLHADSRRCGDLVDYAKANPGKLNWATITGFFDFVFDGFQKKAGLQIAKVPYRNTVQAATDLAEGRIQLMMSAYAILRPHVQSGKLRADRGHGERSAPRCCRTCRPPRRPAIPTVTHRRPGRPVRPARTCRPRLRERIAADVRRRAERSLDRRAAHRHRPGGQSRHAAPNSPRRSPSSRPRPPTPGRFSASSRHRHPRQCSMAATSHREAAACDDADHACPDAP